MHELSIARAIVATIEEESLHDPRPVRKVRLRIGMLAGVVADALAFSFEAAAHGTVANAAELVVEEIPAKIDCPRCGEAVINNIRDFRCPTCGDICGRTVGGDELEIVGIDREPEQNGSTIGVDSTDPIKQKVLAKNDLLAKGLRQRFHDAGIGVSNWISSPGSGKTALLEAMLATAVKQGLRPAILVGDCATDNDAQRLQRSGAQTRQIVTDGRCHLEAVMISEHLHDWELSELDLLVIENVGNLVCPSSFDLGEDRRVVVLSVTEGEDKPLKYPKTFRLADLIVITKMDIAQAVEWDQQAAVSAIRSINPDAPIIMTSAKAGDGIDELLTVLRNAHDRRPATA